MALVEIRNLTKEFDLGGGLSGGSSGRVKAVDGVSLDIEAGETLGLVGESGCGKSTLGRCITRLINPTSGGVRFEGQDLLAMDSETLRQTRRRFQTIFQDPYASLNPRMKIGEIIGEGLAIHKLASGKKRREIVTSMMRRVGLRDEHFDRFPHEFSGGQRQRIGIARALIFKPRFIVADEPVSALDVSIQAQILNLLQDLQEEMQLTFLFVSHDLRVVEHMSQRVAVMYLGRIVEIGDAETLYRQPQHPYTRALLSSVPSTDPANRQERMPLTGDIPSPLNPPSGCSFHPRCPYRQPVCSQKAPELSKTALGSSVSCHVFGEAATPPG